MKFLENLFENKLKPNFEKGGKFEKWFPLYDTLATFAFTPGHTTKNGTHIKDGIDLKRTMFLVIIALIPCLIFGMWNVGEQHFQILTAKGVTDWLGAPTATPSILDNILFGLPKVLPMVIVSYAAGLGVEFIFAMKNRHGLHEGFLVSGMLIPLIMPVECPLWIVAVGTIFAVLIGKEVFGGTGMNILNIALTARAFLFFAYPTKMSGNEVWIATGSENNAAAIANGSVVDSYTGATPLANAFDGKMTEAGMLDIPSVFDSFMGWIPGSIGSTSALMVILGAALLIWTGIASWKIIASAVLGGAVMGLIFNGLADSFPDNEYLKVDWYHQLVLGGFAFGVVFMATDPVTAARTERGKWIYGFFIGILAILIRTVNPAYPEGIMLAILFMNVMAPLIDHYVIGANVKKRLKRGKALASA